MQRRRGGLAAVPVTQGWDDGGLHEPGNPGVVRREGDFE